ncbi:MAG: response regulator [Pseudomonadota bacterium]
MTLGLVVAMPPLVLALWPDDATHTYIEREVSAHHQVLARSLERQLSDYLSQIIDSLAHLSDERANPGINQNPPPLERLGIRHMCVVNAATGNTVTAVGLNAPACPDQLPVDRLVGYLEVLQKSARRSFDNPDSQWALTGVHFAPDGKPIFVVLHRASNRLAYAEVTTDYLVEMASTAGVGKSGYTAIVDQDGRLLAHPAKGWRDEARELSGLRIVQKALNEERGIDRFISPAYGAEMIAGFTWEARSNWGLLVAQPIDEVKTVTDNIMARVIWIASLSSLFALALGAIALSRITSGFAGLPQLVKRTRRGEAIPSTGGLPEIQAVIERHNEVAHELAEMTSAHRRVSEQLHRSESALLDAKSVKSATSGATDVTRWQTIAQEARDANFAKTNFMVGFATELRTPLANLCGLFELLLRTPLDARQRNLVRSARETAEGFTTRIDEIIDIGAIERGATDIAEMIFDPLAVALNAIHLAEQAASMASIELSHSSDLDVPRSIIGDPNRLRSILLHSLQHRLKEGGEAPMRLHVAVAGHQHRKTQLRFEIHQSNHTLSAEELALWNRSLFDPGDSQRETFSIEIAHQLADAMGAKLGGRNAEDAVEAPLGCTIWLTVTAHTIDTQSSLAATNDFAWARHHALVVGSGGDAMVANLSRRGLHCDFVPNAESADHAIGRWINRRTHYHAVFISASVDPNLAGALIDRVRAQNDGASIPIVVAASVAKRDPNIVTFDHSSGDEWLVEQLSYALAHRGQEQLAGPPSAYRVLIAEDDPVCAEILHEYLSDLGCQVDVVDDGKRAIAAANERAYDLIFMDLRMPRLGGVAATRTIRQAQAHQSSVVRVPIIAISAHVHDETRNACLKAGMDDYLAKPIEQDTLSHILDRYLPEDRAA